MKVVATNLKKVVLVLLATAALTACQLNTPEEGVLDVNNTSSELSAKGMPSVSNLLDYVTMKLHPEEYFNFRVNLSEAGVQCLELGFNQVKLNEFLTRVPRHYVDNTARTITYVENFRIHETHENMIRIKADLYGKKRMYGITYGEVSGYALIDVPIRVDSTKNMLYFDKYVIAKIEADTTWYQKFFSIFTGALLSIIVPGVGPVVAGTAAYVTSEYYTQKAIQGSLGEEDIGERFPLYYIPAQYLALRKIYPDNGSLYVQFRIVPNVSLDYVVNFIRDYKIPFLGYELGYATGVTAAPFNMNNSVTVKWNPVYLAKSYRVTVNAVNTMDGRYTQFSADTAGTSYTFGFYPSTIKYTHVISVKAY